MGEDHKKTKYSQNVKMTTELFSNHKMAAKKFKTNTSPRAPGASCTKGVYAQKRGVHTFSRQRSDVSRAK